MPVLRPAPHGAAGGRRRAGAMTAYVFSLGLIPVQEWIAQARRSRDLRVGSAWLSHVMARLLCRLEADLGADVRLPAVSAAMLAEVAGSLEDAIAARYGIPNRASGYCAAADDADLRQRFQAAVDGELAVAWRQLVRGRLAQSPHASAEERQFWSLLAPHLSSYLAAAPAGEDSPFSVVWVAAPRGPGDPDLRRDLAGIDRLFAEVKRSRPVRPWPAALAGAAGKCNQCASREAIGPTGTFEDWRTWFARISEGGWAVRGARIERGERLCYVCLARRLASYGESGEGGKFPATGMIAAGPWLKRARQDAELERLLAGIARTPPGRDDLARALGAPARELAEQDGAAAVRLRADLRARIGTLNAERRRKHPDEPPLPPVPPAYLALLAFDGDDMGRRVREAPERVPAAMQRVAGRVAELLDRHQGRAFYLGGDEGLAMVPAAGALDLALALRAAFAEVFAGADRQGGADGPALTLSMGIAFFEHSRPLAGAIRAARAALAAAKRLEGKDALGVTVQTASGNLWSVAEHWGAFWQRLCQAVALAGEGRLAAGWAHDAEAFVEALPAAAWRQADLPPAARAEIKRLLFRRLKAEGATAEERRRSREAVWAERLSGESWWETGGRRAPRPLPEQFHLVGFLARMAAGAGGGGGE